VFETTVIFWKATPSDQSLRPLNRQPRASPFFFPRSSVGSSTSAHQKHGTLSTHFDLMVDGTGFFHCPIKHISITGESSLIDGHNTGNKWQRRYKNSAGGPVSSSIFRRLRRLHGRTELDQPDFIRRCILCRQYDSSI